MADDVVKRLLIKLGIDGADAVRFIAQLQSQLDGMYQKAKAQNVERKTAQRDDFAAMAKQLDLAKQQTSISQAQVANLRQQIEAKQVTVKQIQEEITKERQALDIRQSTLKIMAQQGVLSADVIKSLERQITLERQKLALQQAQLRATGLSGAAARESGMAGELVGAAAKGLFGGGMMGAVAGGMLGTVGVVEAVQLISEAVRELGKSLMEATGPAQTLRLEFEKLAGGQGKNAEEMLQKMRTATHGLASDTQLYQAANVFMRSNIKMTTDQMTKMLAMTVDLARLNGHTAPEALNAFSLAMERGQPFVLARVAGLTNLQRQMMSLPRGIDPAIASTVRMTMVMNAMTDAIHKGVQPVATTLPELFQQMSVASKNFFDGIAEGVLKTGTLQSAVEKLSKWLVSSMPAIMDFAKAVGEKLGGGLLVASNIVKAFASELKFLWEVLAGIGRLLSGLSFGTSLNAFSDTSKIDHFRQAMGLLALAAENVGHSLSKSATMVRLFFDMMRSGGQEAVNRATDALADENEAHRKAVKEIKGYVSGKKSAAGAAAGAGTTSPFVDQEALKRDEVVRANIRREGAKVELQIAKDEIDAEMALLKNKYEMGLLELDRYLAAENALNARSRDARAKDIQLEAEAQKQAARVKVQPTRMPDGTMVQPSPQAIQDEKDQEVLIDKQTNLKLLENNAEYRKQVVANDEKLFADRKSAELAYQNEIIRIQKEGLAEQESILEKHFKEGNVGPEQYIAQRRAMIEKEAAMVRDELARELQDTAKSEAEKAKIRIEGINNELAAQKKLTDLELKQDEIKVQALENSFSRIKAGLQAQLAASQLNVQQRVPGARGDQTAIIEQLAAANQQYIQQLVQEASTLGNQPQLWAQVVDKIKQATDEQIKLNQQLRDATNIAKPLGNMFGMIAGVAGNIRGGGSVAAIAGSMQASAESLSKYMESGGPSGGIIGGLFGKKKSAAPVIATPQQKAEAATDHYAATVEQTVSQLKAAAEQEASARSSAAKKLVDDLAALAQAFENATQKFIGPPRPPAGPPNLPGVAQPTTSDSTQTQIQLPGTTQPSQSTQTQVPNASTDGSGSGSGGSKTPLGGFMGALEKSTNKLNTFMNGIGGAVSSVGGFIGSLQNAKSAAGGALSGGMSGASMGMQFAGPWGALVGGVGGAVLGGIMGHKRAQVEQDLRMIKAQLQNIVDQLNSGTISISTAIANLRNERKTAISMLSGTKGGKGKKGQPSQLQSVLTAIDQQIQTLLQQQQQLINQMDESILTMSQGIYWQPVLTQLDQIVKQYQQFASAAQGNTQQVAAANEYLTQSLQNYSQTMQQTFLSDQEQAIANAQQLLQLEQQQAEMTNQYQSQVYGILSQGVTSRQLSGAQTKGAEMEALNVQYSQQQLQLKQQIDVANYKYKIQQKIFNLASTQVGLEMEMVAVQDQQANNSLQSVMVLQQAMEAINAALASGNLPALLTGATSTGTQGLMGILQLLGLTVPNVPGVGPGGTNYLQNIPGQWQGIANYMNSVDPNFLLDVFQAMMTAPGSGARQQLISLINNPAYGLATSVQGGVYGAELGGFEQWIANGAPLPTSTPLPPSQPGGYAEGTTYVPQTGIALIHKGEAIIPADQNPWSSVGAGVNVGASAQGALSDAHLQVEQQIYQLVMARVSAEWQLVQAKMQLLQQEQSGSGSGVASFEGGLQKVYENRGRYGSGGVRTEYL